MARSRPGDVTIDAAPGRSTRSAPIARLYVGRSPDDEWLAVSVAGYWVMVLPRIPGELDESERTIA